MSDIAKWVLLVFGILIVIGLILALPIASLTTGTEISTLFGQLLYVLAPYAQTARAGINLFLTPLGRVLFTSVLTYLVLKSFITWPIKLVSSVYHWIFKG